jgi:membrane protease YdiL (CAAX protease family)
MGVPAGWYADPWSLAPLRWWDGTTWTGETASAQPRQAEPTFDGRALPNALGGIAVAIVAARLVSTFALHQLSVPAGVYIGLFYSIIFGGLWLTCRSVSRRFGSGHLSSDFGLAWRPSDLWRGPVVFVVARLAAGIAMSPWIGHTGRLQRLTEGLQRVPWTAFVIFSAFAMVAAPLLEELAFRGMLQRILTARFGPRWAVVGQAIAFSMYHLTPGLGWDNLPYALGLIGFGLVIGLFARRTRRLGTGCLAHALANTFAVIISATSR